MNSEFKLILTFLFLYCCLGLVSYKAQAVPIIADHNAVQQFDQIPQYWIERAKEYAVYYVGSSHGMQVLSGLKRFEENHGLDYSVAITVYRDSPILPNPENPPELLITHHGGHSEEYWSTPEGIANTFQFLDSSLYNASSFMECGGFNGNPPSFDAQDYIDAVNVFEQSYPNIRFIYMTDFSNGTYIDQNHIIRDYVRTNNKILFDFEDIEKHDPEGNYYETATEHCEWCEDWCINHPNDCQNLLSRCESGTLTCCPHTHGYNCKMKAKAFWWLIARLAGWNDPNNYTLNINIFGNGTVTKTPDKVNYELGEIVTLQAIPDPGYAFDYWSGDMTGAVNPVTITMDSSKNINVYFRKIDTQPPSIISVTCYSNSLEITLDEILDKQSAEKISNYSINNDVSITSATLNQDPNIVTLTTSTHREDIVYTLTITNVEDVSGNPMQETTIDYEYDDGLVGCWSFYEGIGLKTTDLSGNGNDGIISGATWFEGRSGKGLQFDGIDDYVDCGNGAALDISGEGAFASWIKVDYPVQSGSMKILSKKNASDATGGYELEYNPSLHYINVSGSGSNMGSAQNVDLNTSWHHVVAVIKGTTAEIYIDSYNRTTDTTVGALLNSGYALQIGRQSMGAGYFEGLIDEVHIYNRALSKDEITNLFYDVAIDLNGDYKVNKFDWAIFAASWAAKSNSQSWNYLCDIAPSGGDGVVDYKDLAVLCNGWLKENGATGNEGIPVPAPWISADIGNPNPGSSRYIPETQTLVVTANGNDIWNQSDNFHFVYQHYSGDCEIVVRIESFPLSLDTWQKAGVMIRDTVAAGSPFVDMVITGGAGNYGSFQWRDLLNGGCGCTNAPSNIGPAPKWIRLVRSGSWFSGYWSNDGATWTQIGAAHSPVMTDPVLVGMCVTSRNNDNGAKMATAKFDNLGGDFSFSMSMPSTPGPANGATDVPVDTDLTWVRGENAIQDDVFFGTNPAALSKVATISAEVLPPSYRPAEDLIADCTYYWKLVETDAALFVNPGPVWSFTTISGKARVLYPADGAVIKGDKYPPTGKPTHIYTVLDFIPGPTAVTHIGYFSDDYSKVYSRAQEASLGSPPYSSMPNRFYAGLPIVPPVTDSLVKGTTYYWTVDAVDAQGNTFPADVWEFTIQN